LATAGVVVLLPNENEAEAEAEAEAEENGAGGVAPVNAKGMAVVVVEATMGGALVVVIFLLKEKVVELGKASAGAVAKRRFIAGVREAAAGNVDVVGAAAESTILL